MILTMKIGQDSCSRDKVITINIATTILSIKFVKYIFSCKFIHLIVGKYDKIFWNIVPVLLVVAVIIRVGVRFPLLMVYEEILKSLYRHGFISDDLLTKVGIILVIIIPFLPAFIIMALCLRVIRLRGSAIEKLKYMSKPIVWMIILMIPEVVFAFNVLQPYKSMLENYIVYLSNSESSDLEIVMNIVRYVEMRTNNSYCKPESVFEIDVHLGPIDLYVLSLLGFDKVHVILYQGWGSCGQYATVVEYILRNLGYETRRAHFVNIDHGWAEVRLNSTWYIIDPWYIGKYAKSPLAPFLVPTCELSSIPGFSNAGPIRVVYPNGTRIDATSQYGY